MTPSISRRDFIKTSAATTALLAMRPAPLSSWSRPKDAKRIRVALFLDSTFPSIDTEAPDGEALKSALSGFDLRVLSSVTPSKLPAPGEIDVLVTPYGSAFPEEVGEMILGFLSQGGCWVNLGGTPLAVPVRWNGKAWQATPRRTAWHRRLGITQSMDVSCRTVSEWRANTQYEGAELLADALSPALCRALYLRLTDTKHFPDEDGSSGPRDAEIHSLLIGADEDGVPIAAPVVLIDRFNGNMAGSRQVFYTGDESCPADAAREMVSIAACGAIRLSVHPAHARIDPGEPIAAIVRLHQPGRTSEGRCAIELLKDGLAIENVEVTLRTAPAMSEDQARISFAHNLQESALYELRATLALPVAGGSVATISAAGGVLVAGDEDFKHGTRIAREGPSLTFDGAPFTVTGTSYMARDVQRSFLLEPNPLVWDQDFRAMREAGVNLVRTGIWTGWRGMMLQPGDVNETVLRSVEAFLLLAAKHDIPVIFTFFAFLPESWGGINPYLDPRSVAAQRSFIAAFVRRCRDFPGVIWDLINEPSFCSPSQLWRCRPNYDDYEVQAWQAWLRKRYGEGSGNEYQRRLGDLWRSDTKEYGALPPLEAFDDVHLFGDRGALKVMDYRLFAQDAFTAWVQALRETIHEAGGDRQLVMVGQDEGGTMDRPNPHFHVGAVDATSVHSWWFNDDLLWDTVVTRAPGKPHIVQETGVMMYEAADGSPWRSEANAATLLKRKLVIALTAGSAGYVQWLWHSNPWMASDNEAAIGALRCDGSAKPEYLVLRDTGLFIRRHAALLTKRKEERVVMILPHSQQFSTRSAAVEATRACVRAMAYGCRTPLRAVSEYTLDDTALTEAQLLLLPCAGMLSEAAWLRLLAAVGKGATLLVTGIIDRDDHLHPMPRTAVLNEEPGTRPVTQTETLDIDGELHHCGFRGEKLQRIETAFIPDENEHRVIRKRIGTGTLLWCPLPVELSDNPAAVSALYRYALKQANVPIAITLDADDANGILVCVTEYEKATLLGVISERSSSVEFELRYHRSPAIEVELPPGGSMMILLDARSREIARVW